MVAPMLFSHLQMVASPKSCNGWRKQLLRSFQIGAFVPMGVDNLVRRSLLTGKGSLSGGSNCRRKSLSVLRVFLTNCSLSAALLSRAAEMDNGAESMRCARGDECDLDCESKRAASGLGTCRWLGFGYRAVVLARRGVGNGAA